MDKISIVVAVYNAGKTLTKCIDSLLNQSYENTEIILVNDCSKDESLEICKEYKSNFNNIKVINNLDNQGVSSTRNNGIKESTGKYICFVDSDDYVEPDYLKKLYDALIKCGVLLSICGSFFDDYTKNKVQSFIWNNKKYLEVVSIGRAFELSNKLYLNALWNKLFVTDLIKSNNIWFDEKLSMGEDTKFSLDYIQKNGIVEVAVLSEPLYHYIRWNNNSLMAKYCEQSFEEFSSNIRQIYEIIKPLNDEAEILYKQALENAKLSIKYSIVRSSYSRKNKIKSIKKLFPDYSFRDYWKDNLIKYKEKIANLVNR